jgi:hypothetical protein
VPAQSTLITEAGSGQTQIVDHSKKATVFRSMTKQKHEHHARDEKLPDWNDPTAEEIENQVPLPLFQPKTIFPLASKDVAFGRAQMS